jgi:hypothetical protein
MILPKINKIFTSYPRALLALQHTRQTPILRPYSSGPQLHGGPPQHFSKTLPGDVPKFYRDHTTAYRDWSPCHKNPNPLIPKIFQQGSMRESLQSTWMAKADKYESAAIDQ